jgi:hypothetical protein
VDRADVTLADDHAVVQLPAGSGRTRAVTAVYLVKEDGEWRVDDTDETL